MWEHMQHYALLLLIAILLYLAIIIPHELISCKKENRRWTVGYLVDRKIRPKEKLIILIVNVVILFIILALVEIFAEESIVNKIWNS